VTDHRPVCHPDRPHYQNDLCRGCYDIVAAAAGQDITPRVYCPGCGRDDVVLLHPTAAGYGRAAKPWRRKAHAIHGSLGGHHTGIRCRYPATLTADEYTPAIRSQ
jgi:hypothetical protein